MDGYGKRVFVGLSESNWGMRVGSMASEATNTPRGGSLVESVIDYVYRHVADEGLRPGAKLPSETKISVTLGVSRPVVREALRTLAATGLIEMAVGKRAEIVPVDGEMLSRVIGNALVTGQADTRNILELRRGIEISMVALAAERRSDADADALQKIVREMASTLGDAKRFTELDLKFHALLARATGNPLYTLLIDAFRQLIAASMSEGIERWSATPELRRVQDLHENIVAAVVAGDPANAAGAMAQHFDSALMTILAPIVAGEVAD